MRIKCLHGYFIFKETRVGQISDFIRYSGLSLVPKLDYFTFETLEPCPEYTLSCKDFLGAAATKTVEGKPWELFKENGVVYDFTKDILVPILSVAKVTEIRPAGEKLLSPGLILPGSVTVDGDRVMNYSAWFSMTRLSFQYSEVTYV